MRIAFRLIGGTRKDEVMTVKNDEPTAQNQLTGEAPQPGKKPYAKPQLSVYGNVEQITKGADAGLQDGDSGTSIGGGV